MGQSGFRSESEMKAKASDYFSEDQFNLAFPLYSQLLSLDPKNVELNYRFGVCLMYTDRSDTEAPIKYLEKAINKVTDIAFYYHLAVAYQNNYFFTDAIYNYRKYSQLARKKARKDYEVNRKIAMCQNGMDMMKAADDLYVMQKSEVERKAFYRSYELVDFGGRFLNLPEEFLSKADLKSKQENITYFNPKAKLLFYARINKNQKDIYYRIRQNSGDWSVEMSLSNTINTSYDEDYPFLMPDGKTLYFSSKGHNTMGGFDIFRSVYDSISRQWSSPSNLSFPFNTPSDDILFISDADETMAWFASNRNSLNDKITVYKVGIIKKEQQSADLSGIYDGDKLSGNDLGRIKNMAMLDINISDKEFREIPVDQKQKLEVLKKNDASRISQNIRQVNLINIDKQIEMQEIQTGLNDSIKIVVQQIDTKLEYLKSLYLKTQDLITAKTSVVQVGYKEVYYVLEKAEKATHLGRKKDLIKSANIILFKTLRHEFQNNKLKDIKNAINDQIKAQRSFFNQANSIFGDIQKSIVQRNAIETKKNIISLNQLIQSADTLIDYSIIVNYTNGNLIHPNYSSNLMNEESFAIYYLENEGEYLSPILMHKKGFSSQIPKIKKTSSVELLRSIEKKANTIQSKNNELSFQLEQIEIILKTKRLNTLQLLKEVNYLVRAFESRPTQDLLSAINSKSANARQVAYEAYIAEEVYKKIKSTDSTSRIISSELDLLKNNLEQRIENGNNKQTLDIEDRVSEIQNQINLLSSFEEIFNFNTKELSNISYPTPITNIDDYVEYTSQDNKLQRKQGKAYTYISVEELILSSKLLSNEPAPKSEPESSTLIASKIEIDNATQEIRTKLSTLNQKQTQSLNQLQQQSALLTQKASTKLEASNIALLNFERMRKQYYDGLLTDKNKVITKQEESQTLLYQSLAINDFAKRIDSIYTSALKQKKESNVQIFAIEQALQSSQIEKAKVLTRALYKSIYTPNTNIDLLIQNWVDDAIKIVPDQKMRANKAFENSQKLTDESFQLLLSAQEIRENKKNKSSAFRRRDLEIKAEKKETLGLLKQDQADNQLVLGTKLHEQIKRIESLIPIKNEFSSTDEITATSKPIINPEKRKTELNERLKTREKETPFSLEPNKTLLAQANRTIHYLDSIPEMNDIISFETKRYKAQLLAEELDINKRETVLLLKASKTLKGSNAIENDKKIHSLREEAKSLQLASTETFIQAENIYQKLSSKDKKQADKNKNNFENYLKNIQNRIAQLLNEVNQLAEQAKNTSDKESQLNLMKQADEKEQIAMYLLLEEYEIIAQRNWQNYRKNGLAINELYNKNLNEQEKDLMVAIFHQIDSYMIQAADNRVKARNKDLSFALKKVLFLDAFSYESNSLDLQLEAILMMREKNTERMLVFQPNKQTIDQDIQIASHALNLSALEKSPSKRLRKEKAENLKLSITQDKETKVKPETSTKTSSEEREESNNTEPELIALDVKQEMSITKPANSSLVFPAVKLEHVPNSTMFSVQIAAVKGHKTTNIFPNVIQLFALKDEKRKLYRYFSGRFTRLKPAIIRRNSLRQQGYSDAFIKSWKEGKTVSMLIAAGELDESTIALLNEPYFSLPSKYRNINFSATNISQLNGVYYSVQVGVFSRPRSSEQLFNIKPLYHNRLNNGYWVYFNGIFQSINKAEVNKNTVRTKGISDAFIVAFNEGEKVSLSNARKAISQGNSLPADEDIIIFEDAATEVDNQLKTIFRPQKTNAKSLVYKIQIGVFTHQISMDWILEKLDKSNQKINYFVSSTGKHVYTIGRFNTYAEAANFNTNKVKKVIKDAFIVSFKNGDKITISK